MYGRGDRLAPSDSQATAAMFRLRPETPADGDEVELLLDTAFGPGRTGLSSYRLRQGVAPVAELCLLAHDDYGSLAGSIRYWPVRIGDDHSALLLGPVAVHPTRQGEGLGAWLIVDTLERAVALGWTRVVLVGDEPYYSRFGFRRALATGLIFPPPVNESRLLARELVPGAMDKVSGTVRRWSEQ